MGFPGGTSGKEPTCQCRRLKRWGLDLWVRKIPWRRACNPLQYSCLENLTDERVWWAMVHRVPKSQTRLKQFSTCVYIYTHTHTHTYMHMDFPDGSEGKESTFNVECRRHRRHGINPWFRKISWRRKWQSTPVFFPGKSMDIYKILFQILFHYRLLQDIEYSSPCYPVGPCCFSVLLSFNM